MIAGRYSLDHEIGRGGMGAVWLGRDEVLGRPVALKRVGLLPGADRADMARAEREARLSARLNHQHVVSVFDFVADPDSDARWLVMEYVDGITLAQVIQRGGPLSPDDAAPLLWQVADALVAAHASGIVHRDVKPSNILVDRTWRAKLTDFGIARIETDVSLTQTGLLTGSPAYLAPEVVTGGRGDQSGDVWSLGATLYYVLSGQAPYAVGENVMSTLYRIVNEDPPRLSDAGRLAPLLDATMVKDPARRWSMEQVRDFLADPPAAADEQPTQVIAPLPEPPPAAPPPSTPPPSTPGTTAASAPSRRLLLAGAAALVVLLVGAVLWAVLHGGGSPKERTANPPSTPSSQAPSKTKTAAPEPTAAGMESFIRDYVAAVSADPDQSWTMLTPKFKKESGGLAKYRSFWSSATNGRVLDITADPDNLSVSYQVHFDNFDNGPGPTVLDLKFHDGHYLIDGERTKGFHPAG
jgi:eukaryotic-like serine/threonine-protein kinase